VRLVSNGFFQGVKLLNPLRAIRVWLLECVYVAHQIPPCVIHMQIAGFIAHAAFKSCGAAEHGIPFSCTHPGAGGGHGLPSGLTQFGQMGAAWAAGGAAAAISVPRAIRARKRFMRSP
jgi:hypothetical protein